MRLIFALVFVVAAAPAAADERYRFFDHRVVTLYWTYVGDGYGPTEFTRDDGTALTRGAHRRRLDGPRLELSTPLNRVFSAEVTLSEGLSSDRAETWNGESVVVDTRSTQVLFAVSATTEPLEGVTLSARGGALATRNTLRIDDVGQERDTSVRALVGVGARYATRRGFTVSATYDAARAGYRSGALGVGWTFRGV